MSSRGDQIREVGEEGHEKSWKTLNNIRSVAFVGPQGRLQYLLENPVTGDVFQVGEEEFFILEGLRAGLSADEIRHRFQVRFGKRLRAHHLESFLVQVSSWGLMPKEGHASTIWRRPSGGVTLFGGKSLFLRALMACFSSLLSHAGLFFTAVIVFVAFGVLGRYAEVFAQDMKIFWDPGPFFLETALGIFGVNLAAEWAKGAAAIRCGVPVDRFSLHFLYRIIPHFVCEFSPDYWFAPLKDRLKILAAGIYVQWLLWGASLWAWKISSRGTGVHDFFTIAVLACTFFGIVNFMPFLYRDGYFILSQWLSVESLQERSRAYVKAWVFGRRPPEALRAARKRFFLWYGLASYAYEWVLWVVLLGILCYLMIYHWNLRGSGCVLFLIVLALRMEMTLRSLFRFLMPRHLHRILAEEQGSMRYSKLVKLGLFLVFALISLIPYHYETSGRFRVIPAEEYSVRAVVPGRIVQVRVRPNQLVEAGQVLVVLDDKDQRAEVERLEASLRRQQAELALLRQGPKPEEVALARQEMEKAAADYEFWRKEAQRARGLHGDGAMTDKDYAAVIHSRDQAWQACLVASKHYDLIKSGPRPEEIRVQEAAVEEIQAQLNQARQNLRDTVIRSPVAGRMVAYPFPTPGQYLSVGDMVGVVQKEDVRRMEVLVPQYDAELIRPGDKVRARAWAYPTEIFSGRIEVIDAVAHDDVKGRLERTLTEREMRTEPLPIQDEKPVVRVLCRIEDGQDQLLPGMTGYAKIAVSQKPLILAFTQWLIRFVMVEVWSWLP